MHLRLETASVGNFVTKTMLMKFCSVLDPVQCVFGNSVALKLAVLTPTLSLWGLCDCPFVPFCEFTRFSFCSVA